MSLLLRDTKKPARPVARAGYDFPALFGVDGNHRARLPETLIRLEA